MSINLFVTLSKNKALHDLYGKGINVDITWQQFWITLQLFITFLISDIRFIAMTFKECGEIEWVNVVDKVQVAIEAMLTTTGTPNGALLLSVINVNP